MERYSWSNVQGALSTERYPWSVIQARGFRQGDSGKGIHSSVEYA